MARQQPILYILRRHIRKEALSQQQQEILDKWRSDSPVNENLYGELSDEGLQQKWLQESQAWDPAPVWNKVEQTILHRQLPDKRRKQATIIRYIAVSAAAAILLAIVLSHLIGTTSEKHSQNAQFANDLVPVAGNSVLTLANGQKISLDSIHPSQLATLTADKFRTTADGITVGSSLATDPLAGDNILTTSRGAQYQLQLSDGTKVWLDAGSKLIFPTAFTGGSRKVSLEGQAYFEVAKDPSKPFLLTMNTTTVKVLGTNFTVSSYDGEPQRTSLLQGAVVVRSGKGDSVLLHPGQQTTLSEGSIFSTSTFDADQALAWKNRLFWFQDQQIGEIMKELQRWYSLDLHYNERIDQRFTAILPRNSSLVEILRTLEKPGYIHFTLNGNHLEIFAAKRN